VNSAPVSVLATSSLFPSLLTMNTRAARLEPARPGPRVGYFRQYCEKSE
jgi:hypothetical protein